MKTNIQPAPARTEGRIANLMLLLVSALLMPPVYARRTQTGRHLAELDGYPPTGLPLVEVASAVYRLENGKIAEYWIQIDRLGLERPLQHNAKPNNAKQND